MAPAGYAPFFYVYVTALAGIELLVGLVFAWRARAESSRRIALLAAAYAWSLPLAIANVLAIASLPPLVASPLQFAPTMWIVWHLGWAALLAVYAVLPEGRSRRSTFLIPAVFAAAIATVFVALSVPDALPPLLTGNLRSTPAFHVGIGLSFALDAAIVIRLLGLQRSAREIWVTITVAFAALESMATFAIDSRFTEYFFIARVLSMGSAVSMLFAVALDALAVVQRATLSVAEAERISEFRAIADAVPQIVWRMNADGRNVYVNDRWTEYTGHERENERDPNFRDAIHPDDLAQRNIAFTAAANSRSGYEAVIRLRAADGSYRHYLTRGNPVFENGELTGWVGTSTDIEERKLLENRQRRAYEREAHDAERMRMLAGIGRALAQSLDLDVVYAAAVTGVVPSFADFALLNTRDAAGDVTVAAVHHRDAARAAALQQLIGHSYIRPDVRSGTLAVAASGASLHAESIAEADLRAAVRPEFADLLADLRPASSLIVPLMSSSVVRGSLVLVYAESGRAYAAEDLELAEEIGRRIALSIENSEHFERERRVADRLQEATLPRQLPVIPGVELDAVYQAGRAEAQVGGDWFDAFESSDGRLIFGVGDVMGSGLAAAVTMGAVRQAIRGAAEVSNDPVRILDAVDRALTKNRGDCIVTAFLGILDPRSRELVYASAGHPPPFVKRADGRIERLAGTGIPLGLRCDFPQDDDHSHTTQLSEEALLVLYTDGLVEVDRDPVTGERRLTDVLNDIAPGENLARDILNGVLGANAGGLPSDDIAILTVKLVRDAARARSRIYEDIRDERTPRQKIPSIERRR